VWGGEFAGRGTIAWWQQKLALETIIRKADEMVCSLNFNKKELHAYSK